MPTVNTGTELRSAIQAIGTSDPIELQGTGSFSSAITLGKRSSTNPAPFPFTGYTVQGAGSSAATSATLQDTQIYQQNTDSAFLPGTVQNLTLNYSSSSNGKPLLSIEPKGAQTPEQTLTIKNVDFTGTTTGWDSNGNLYMSLRSFSNTNPLKTTFTLDNVNVSIKGQNNGFTTSPTTGGSAFLHNWNNSGLVTIKDSIFDEGGFSSSFNFYNFGTLASTPTNVISGNTFKRTTNANVRDQGNLLGNVNATLTSNTFQDGAYIDLYGTISGITFNNNTFDTIANGYGIRVTPPNPGGTPTFGGTNTFTGTGAALKYESAAGGTDDFINYSGTFSVGGKSFTRLLASGEGDDNLSSAGFIASLAGQNSWISADAGNDIITSNNGNDSLNGGDGNDSLTSNAGLDTLDGGAGNDSLFGGGGVDILNGGADNDSLVGASGNDTLTGGTGADIFQWNTGDNTDTITDFSIAENDQMRLGTAPFANTAPTDPVLNPFDYQTVLTPAALAAANLNGKVTEVGFAYTTTQANSLTRPAGQNGYLLFFDTTSNTSWLYFDNNWATVGGRTAIHLPNINTLGALTACNNTQFREL